ncbi:MAG: hypothetical protein NVS4B12_24990 [Ktedonobacteraceae bacterium]
MRNYGNIPVVDASTYHLTVTGMAERPLENSRGPQVVQVD